MVTNMDADAQVPALYVQEIDRAVAAADEPHLLVGTHCIAQHSTALHFYAFLEEYSEACAGRGIRD